MATFKFDTKKDAGLCLAYIDADGDLIVLDSGNDGVMIFTDVLAGEGPAAPNASFHPHEDGVKRRFYAGDSITITF